MVLKFSNKELVLSGCSMVADYVRYRNQLAERGESLYNVFNHDIKQHIDVTWKIIDPFPTITEIMAKHYSMIPVDLANPGSGNKQIFNKLCDYVINNHKNIGLVVACWSSFTRMDYEVNYDRFPPTKYNYKSLVFSSYEENAKNKRELHDDYEFWVQMLNMGHIFPEKDMNDFYRYSIMLDTLCASYGIECVQCASIQSNSFTENLQKKFTSHPMASKINLLNFYGWPIFWNSGGRTLCVSEEKYNVAYLDTHPNELGHQTIAKKMIDFIEKRGIL